MIRIYQVRKLPKLCRGPSVNIDRSCAMLQLTMLLVNKANLQIVQRRVV